MARNALRTGQLIKPEDLRWQAWPQGALPQTYIIEGKRPLSDFVGAVARTSFRVGQPLVDTDIVMPGSRGFLAAVLRPGLRAVSVPATATSAVSGFIYAGDRVDVLLTHALNGRRHGQHRATETILRNARVIAMDQKLDFAPGDKPDVAKTATLELTAKQTEIVTLGVKMGELSLVLRSLQDEEERDGEGSGDDATAELGQSYTHDTQVSRLIKEPAPPKPPEAAKPAIFVLRGAGRTKLELDGSTTPDRAAAAGRAREAQRQQGHQLHPHLPECAAMTPSFAQTLPSAWRRAGSSAALLASLAVRVPAVAAAGAGPDERPRPGPDQAQGAAAGQEGARARPPTDNVSDDLNRREAERAESVVRSLSAPVALPRRCRRARRRRGQARRHRAGGEGQLPSRRSIRCRRPSPPSRRARRSPRPR